MLQRSNHVDIADRYMAPEVFLHQHYDKSVDVFSFGIIVQEVLSEPINNTFMIDCRMFCVLM